MGAPHPHKLDAQWLLESALSAGESLVTDAEVLQVAWVAFLRAFQPHRAHTPSRDYPLGGRAKHRNLDVRCAVCDLTIGVLDQQLIGANQMVATTSDLLRSRLAPDVERRIHHRHSAQSFAVSLATRFIVKNAVRAWAIQPDLQWPFESLDRLAGLLPSRPSAKIERVQLDNCRAEWIRAANAPSERAILYLHGGAFLTCGLNTHRAMVTRLSKAADASVLNVDYRMLPRHRILDAINDGLSGLRWLRRRGYGDDDIVVAGDSAGGYLAFMTTLAAIQRKLAKPAGIATVSPFTDADPAGKLGHRNARRCSMFSGGALSAFAHLLRNAEVVSPVDADLSSLPPVTIHASSDELLLPDAELMAQRLDRAGVPCDLHLWDGQIHDFPLAADVLPEGRRAIHYLGEFVRGVTEHPSGDNQAA